MDLHSQKNHLKRALLIFVGFPAVLYVLWATSHFVIAYQETKHAHIFPKAVNAAGWDNPNNSLTLNLSAQAPYGSFTQSNSAYIDLAAATSSEETIEIREIEIQAPTTSVATSTVQPPVASTTATAAATTTKSLELPLPVIVASTSSSFVPSTSSPAAVTADTSGAPTSTTPVTEAAEASTTSKLPPSNIIQLLEKAMPSASSSATSTLSTTTQSFIGRFLPFAARQLQGAGEFLLSQVVETAFATTTSVSSPTTTMQSAGKSVASSTAATSSNTLPTPSSTPIILKGEATSSVASVPDVSSCAITGDPCHTLEFSGFGVSGSIMNKEFHGAAVNFSFANLSEENALQDGKLEVRYFHAGKWQTAGDIFLNKEISNSSNGSYFSADLDSIQNWDDLSDLRVVVEYVRGDTHTESKVFLDALWIDTSFKDRVQDILNGNAGAQLTDVPNNVTFSLVKSGSVGVVSDGAHILFPYLNSNTDGLVIRTDRAEYASADSLSQFIFLSVTNTGTKPDTFSFLPALPASSTVISVEQYLRDVPTEIISVKKDNVTYFCESGWKTGTTTGMYSCSDGQSYRCSWLNDSGDNCLVAGVAVASSTAISYTDTWVAQDLIDQHASTRDFKEKLPEGYVVDKETQKTIDVLPGQTVYLRVKLSKQNEEVQRFKFFAEGDVYTGTLDSTALRSEASLLADQAAAKKRADKQNIDTQLSQRNSFRSDEIPEFKFKYNSQHNVLVQWFRNIFGIKSNIKVNEVVLVHHSGKHYIMPADVTYSPDGEWDIKFKERPNPMMPGEYTLLVKIEEDGKVYEDEHTFTWGELALNTTQSIYDTDSSVAIQMAALSQNGNTVCDANLELSVIDPSGTIQHPAVLPSGLCDGNNFVGVPDYSATYQASVAGTYQVLLTRFDENGDVFASIEDTFEVRAPEALPLVIVRTGPTRINPTYKYEMQIAVTAREAFSGTVHEHIPDNFSIPAGDGQLGQNEIIWNVKLAPGETKTLRYTYDAPDISPYLFTTGPLAFVAGDGSDFFKESRAWQIASDAAGSMIIYWDDGATIPAGWTCISCVAGDAAFQRFLRGSDTYGGTGGAATHNHTATGAVNASNAAATESSPSTAISEVGHSHTYTPVVSSTSSLPLYRQLRIIRSTSAGDPATIPAGAIVVFDSSVPTGWTRYSAQDDRYIRGETTVGSLGGNNTHTHTVTGNTSAAGGTDQQSRGGGTQTTGAAAGHTHSVSTQTGYVNNEPPYITAILGKLTSSTSTPNNIITMWDGDLPDGWVNESDASGPFYQRFIKGGTTYGTLAGSTTHTEADITGVVSSVPSATTNGRTGTAGASGSHTHLVDITNFSYESNLPPYLDVIYAKRHAGIPAYNQAAFRWYANNGTEPPTDPWPFGASDLSENQVITTSNTATSGVVLRLRMALKVTIATSTASGDSFKLQYASSTACSAASTWTDVGPLSSSTAIWRGYDNAGKTDGATLSSSTLSVTNVKETYEEENNSATVPNDIYPNQYGEWDWVLQHNGAVAGATYCFRMIRSDGSALDTYSQYPQLVTNSSPGTPLQPTPFPNQKATSTAPTFQFSLTDPESNDIDYEIQVGTNSTFTSGLIIDANSVSNSTAFDNILTPSDKAPFNSGDTIQYVATTTLSNGTTYWWRIRGKDGKGSNAWGSWSSAQSFTIDTSVTIDTWFQTTDAQFNTDTLSGTESTGSNSLHLITGSSSGSIYSSDIQFAWTTLGNAWGALSWNQSTSTGSIKYYVEYLSSGGTWSLIPDSDLSGNSSGFTFGPVSLLTLDPTVYTDIRVRADLTNSGGSPTLNDWTVSWGTRVNKPTVYSLFDNEKTSTTTPSFEFTTTDPQSDDLVYQVQWSTDATFGTGTTKTSDTDSGFQDITLPADTTPFTSGNRIRFTMQSANALTNNTTYWWRVRAKDPNGGNAYSDWSTSRSFTVDTTVAQSTWFQTTDEQFDTDTLSGLYTVSSSLQVATSVSDVMLAYAEGTVQTPRYRLWNGSSWGSQSSALTVGSAINWVVTKAHPSANEYALGTEGTNSNVYVQVYQNGAWASKQLMTTVVGSTNARGFDLAYESQSGRLLAVYCDGDANPSYRIFDGTSWGSANAISTGLTSNCNWLKLASNPTSNEIVMLMQTADGNTFQAQVWNGSTWGNSTTLGTNTTASTESMVVEYEESGNQAVIVSSDGNPSRVRWSAWNGTAWSAATTQTISGKMLWATLRRDKGSDNMILSYIDSASNVGVIRWTGSAWAGQTNLSAAADSTADRGVDGVFENTGSRDGFIMVPYSNSTAAQYQFWNGASWSAAATLASIARSATVQTVRDGQNTVLAIFFDHINNRYDFSSWNGTIWAALQTLEATPSVSSSPYKEPFMMAPRNAATAGSVFSSSITFTDGSGPRWFSVSWNDIQTGGATIKYALQYYTATSTWADVLDADLTGNNPGLTNSAGTSTGPIDISGLSTSTYGTLRLKANFTCNGTTCPTVNDWTVKWAPGYTISGIAKQFDQTTNVTSGTVAVAVNGSLQVGKIGTISGGAWTIANVNFSQGDTIEIFVDGAADANEAATVLLATSTANIGGVPLYEKHLTIAKGGIVTNSDLSLYDNSASGDEDIFFDVDANNDLTVCAVSGCFGSRLLIVSGAMYEPDVTGSGNVTTGNLQIDGTFKPDGNTVNVSGSWRNSAAFIAGTSTVVFTATSSTETIDNTSATSSKFNAVTFGQTSGTAKWNLASPLYASSTLAISFGTLVQNGANPILLDGNLTIGSGGLFAKGIASTTFEGTASVTWSDSSPSKQDLGIVVIDGSAKTVTLGSSVQATNIVIGADDTLDAGGANTISVIGNWINNNVFTAQTGTVNFIATTTNRIISEGASNFYNLTFNGSGGNWAFTDATITAGNNFTVSAGIVTMPTGTTTVGGNWDTFGGTFQHNNGKVLFNASAAGKTIHVATSTAFYDMTFNGTGAWSFIDQNATSSRTVLIQAGTLTLPSGTLAIGGSFTKSGGSFSGNNGVLKFTAATANTVFLNGSSAGGLTFNGSGSWTISDANATSTGSLRFENGAVTMPSATFAVGGSLVSSSGTFAHNTGTVKFTATATGNTVNPGSSNFYNLVFNGSGGGWTIAGNATSTHDTIFTQGSVTLASGKTLEVDGTFTNALAAAATTWTGSNLYLNSGTTYVINSKTGSGANYGQLTVGGNTNVSMWNSSASSVSATSNSSVYSQNNASVSGSLYIYGAYTNTGNLYWAYATDFDGTALGGSSRQVNVRIASSSVVTLSGSTTIQGIATASTTIANQGSGFYSLNVTAGTTSAQYFTIASTTPTGLSFSGSNTVISNLSNGAFELSTPSGGSSITVASSVIDKNPAAQWLYIKFATSTGVTSGFNVSETGTPSGSNNWWFREGYGGLYGEAYDNDPGPGGGNPGYIQWDDSGFTVTIAGHVYSNHGTTVMNASVCDGTTPVVKVVTSLGLSFSGSCNGSGAYSIPNVTFPASGVITVFLNNAPGGVRAVAITKSATNDILDLDLYQNDVIVRQADVTPTTITDMSYNDSSYDTDIPFTVTTSPSATLTLQPNTELYVWTGKLFAPGGNVTLQSGGSGDSRDGSLYVATSSTFTAAGSQSHSIGGSLHVDSGATFTSASSTITFTATTTGKSIFSAQPLTLYDVVFNGSGGQWLLNSTSSATTTMHTLALTAGTLAGTGGVDLQSGDLTGSGTITMTGGIFLLENTGNFGNSNAWQFRNLVIGSGAASTITKTGSASTTVTGFLKVSTSASLNAGSSSWIFTGGGTPFQLGGSFSAQSAPFWFMSTSSANITATTYSALYFAPPSNTPAYTILSGTLVATSTTIGDGTHGVTVTAAANDPTIDFVGDLQINSNATFIASDLVDLNSEGNWSNGGTFTPSNRTVIFDATAAGKSVTPGNSSFYNAQFNSSSGGWTISGNATTTNNFTLSSAQSFTLASGKSLEVKGTFSNAVASSSQTWTGSTLYLNSGTNYTINSKSSGNALYGQLTLGSATNIRSWNSAQVNTTVASDASLYAMNYASSSGALRVYGAYARSSGSDYWDYSTDFDGVSLGATSRKVTVSVASSSTLTFSGTALLDIIGSPNASTTIQNQGSGAYAWNISGGTLNAQYYEVRNTDASGLNLSGYPVISGMSNGDFQLSVNGGSMITINGTVIVSNPLKVLRSNSFATTSGITSGFNVTPVAATSSFWKFNLHYGNFAGESYDNDADPGFIHWDDSADHITISGKVYSDEGATVSSVCNGSTQVVRLKVGGVGAYTASCDASTGAYSIPNVSYNPGDSFIVYLDSGGGRRGSVISRDPSANITNMDLYENRVIVRHESTSPLSIGDMVSYDSDNDTDIPFNATSAATSTLVLDYNTKLVVWTGKTFAPNGNVTTLSGSGNAWDGSVEIYANAAFSGSGTQTYSIGGSFVLDSGATFSAANSTVLFTSTTTGRTITPQNSSFYNISFNGTGGNWAFNGGYATSTNDFTITNGTVTLPTTVLAVGGSFLNTGGTFMHNNGRVEFTSAASGKTIQVNNSPFYDFRANGTGGAWSFVDANATTSNNFTITAGTVTAPSGILAVGGSFSNSATFNNNNATVKMTALSGGKSIQTGGANFYNLTFSGAGGGWTFLDTSATTSRDLTVATGTPRFPTGTLAVGGNFNAASSTFISNFGTVKFTATTTGFTVSVGTSTFYSMLFDSSAGGWTINTNATSTASTTITHAASFTLASGKTLEVDGHFANSVGTETWTGSNLYLNSGDSYSINGKTDTGASYGQITVGNNMGIRMWNSSVTTVASGANASLYSQDNANTDGALNIYGTFSISSGMEYWSYATDFDGTALGGTPRQVQVRIATSSAISLSGGTLNIVGIAGATTTVRTTGIGSYSFAVSGGTFNANYYQFKNFDSSGLAFTGLPNITSLSNGDFELSAASGTILTLAGTVVDSNANLNITNVRMATTSPNTQGFNVYLTSTPGSFWTFGSTYGNFSGEAYDADGTNACGHIRWDDSLCNFNSEAHYRWRNDDGGEGALNSEWYDLSFTRRKKIQISNANATAYTNIPVKIDVGYDSDMRSDFRDLRFTDSTGTSTLTYWTESSTTATSTVWVKVPSLPGSNSATIYMYYGSSTAVAVDSASNTFSFIDDFEDGNITEYTAPNGTSFAVTTGNPPAHNGSYGLHAASAHENDRTLNGGIYRTGSLTAPGKTMRYFQYVDASGAGAGTDEPCTFFGVQGAGQNYGVCLEQVGGNYVGLSKNVRSNATQDGATLLTSTPVTWSTGWYEVVVDWQSSGTRITVRVYDSAGTLFATLTSSDTTYTSAGGMGFGFFAQHGGWDTYMVKPYTALTPTYIFGSEQQSGGATWKAAEDTPITGIFPNTNLRLRFSIQNTGSNITNAQYNLQSAPLGSSINCESVAPTDYQDVPVAASCGTAAACMTTSSNFTNLASTSPSLSYPASLFFTPGYIIQDPKNITNAMTHNAFYATEVEYNFQVTNNASGSNYCFRVTNNDIDLANYDHVAQVAVVHPPFISNFSLNNAADIILVEGTTTTIYASSTVTDLNGYTDLVSATSTIYRSGVTGGPNCTADENNCYQIPASSCSFSNCSGNSCTLTCRADIQYFAEPTDASSTRSAETWLARMSVNDSTSLNDTQTSLGVDLLTLYGLEIQSSAIDFGTLVAGGNTGTTDATSTIRNTGNSPIDIQVSGTDLTSGANSIGVGEQKYSTTTFAYGTCSICQFLTGSATNVDVNIPKPSSTSTPATTDLYWGIDIPLGTSAETYSGTNTFIAIGQ